VVDRVSIAFLFNRKQSDGDPRGSPVKAPLCQYRCPNRRLYVVSTAASACLILPAAGTTKGVCNNAW
jgi:hypothetical protein